MPRKDLMSYFQGHARTPWNMSLHKKSNVKAKLYLSYLSVQHRDIWKKKSMEKIREMGQPNWVQDQNGLNFIQLGMRNTCIILLFNCRTSLHVCCRSPLCFILLTHEGSYREVYQEFQPSSDIFRRWLSEYARAHAKRTHSQLHVTCMQTRAS